MRLKEKDRRKKISEKMKEIQKGENNSNWKDGRSSDKNYMKKYKRDFYQKKYAKNNNYGWTLERKRECSEMMKGKNSPLWIDGRTKENILIRNSYKYRAWRNQVFERDNWTCQICGKRGGDLEADHIKSFSLYPELRFVLSNGRTLCLNCHKKTDTYLNRWITKPFEMEVK